VPAQAVGQPSTLLTRRSFFVGTTSGDTM
jgi:hypothetical protein